MDVLLNPPGRAQRGGDPCMLPPLLEVANVHNCGPSWSQGEKAVVMVTLMSLLVACLLLHEKREKKATAIAAVHFHVRDKDCHHFNC